jgi:L-lysine exporter family protein LysE/ArgO
MATMELSLMLTSAAQGFAIGLALIVAIGAQNAFVLRQGLRREQLGLVIGFCAGMDALLIAVGVFGAAWTQQRLPWLTPLLTALGVAFLLGYGLLSLRRALRPGASLLAAAQGPQGARATLLHATAFTLLNPHVYLDTVLLVGSVGAQQAAPLRPAFVAGASLGSLLWFSLIGLGAAWAAPWLRRPRAWVAIDLLMGLLLIGLAVGLLLK